MVLCGLPLESNGHRTRFRAATTSRLMCYNNAHTWQESLKRRFFTESAGGKERDRLRRLYM